MIGPLHIIEPTLKDETGHCYSFVASICHAAGDYPITVWCDHDADIELPPHVVVRRYFYRRLRRFQALWIYRTLLRQPGRLFVSTAGRIDLTLIDLAAPGTIPVGKVFLYVHWFRTSPAKRRQLKKLASRNPEINIFTPTASVYEEFRSAGFSFTRQIPYPITPRVIDTHGDTTQGFSHVLFAGAARRDKGFGDVLAFVELLAEVGSDIRVSLQTSAQHYSKTDDVTSATLERLEQLEYPYLKCYAGTLQYQDYYALFKGAICLQLYSRHDFADRISGVTLDALSMGSPVITLSGTWMAQIVTEFEAGLVVESPAPDVVLSAVNRIITKFHYYHNRAMEAGFELQKRNSANLLFQGLIA